MICQTVSKKHKAAGFPLTEPLTPTFLSKLYFFTQIKLPLSNGQEILLILNILLQRLTMRGFDFTLNTSENSSFKKIQGE